MQILQLATPENPHVTVKSARFIAGAKKISKTIKNILSPEVEHHFNENGDLHCLTGPAVIFSNGVKEWWLNGQSVSEAEFILNARGIPYLRKNGKCSAWYLDGVFHRDNGPAITYEGDSEEWYYKGQRHRYGYPAIVRSDGTEEWWIYGTKIFDE
jgi:hypothetical protein